VPDVNNPSKLADHGVHAFVVPLRDPSGNCLPGVEIRDCGYKARYTDGLHMYFRLCCRRMHFVYAAV
jgi:hypothetical protein